MKPSRGNGIEPSVRISRTVATVVDLCDENKSDTMNPEKTAEPYGSSAL